MIFLLVYLLIGFAVGCIDLYQTLAFAMTVGKRIRMFLLLIVAWPIWLMGVIFFYWMIAAIEYFFDSITGKRQ